MNIVVGLFQQETNTLSCIKSHINDFDIICDEKMLNKLSITNYLKSEGVNIIPTIYANAMPSGKLDKDSFYEICKMLICRIPDNIKIDGIWIHLHGALEVEEVGSGELETLKLIREKVGCNIPIAVVLDFHANNTTSIVDYANVFCGYKTAPHTDIDDMQMKAATLLVDCIKNNRLPVSNIVRLPMMIIGDKVITDVSPMKDVINYIINIENEDEILNVSVFNGQNWVDADNAGASVIVTVKNDKEYASKKAIDIGKFFWEKRHEFKFSVETYDIDEAMKFILINNESPVFLTDSGDNTTAGGAGDNSIIIKKLIEAGAKDVLVGGITDAPCVNEFMKKDIGETIEFHLGGTLDKEFSTKVVLNGVLLKKGNIEGWYGEDAGNAVLVRCMGIDIIITEKRCALISPEIFQSIGVDVFCYKSIIVKQGYLYPKLSAIAKKEYMILTPGASYEIIENINFKYIKKNKIFPFNKEVQWVL